MSAAHADRQAALTHAHLTNPTHISVLAWLAARDVRPRVGFVAAVLLSAICLMSVLFGLFDGDLIGNIASDGFMSWGVVWVVPLLCATVVVGVLAFVRARQLRRLR